LFLLVRHEDAVPLEDDEFYLYQLIGLRVETSDGLQLGIISKYMETGANDVYIIQSPKYGEILFPATHETIIDHDIANGVVRVNLPDGLINPISDEDADD
jgi:16S rRNA processing protein RimM